MDAPDNLSHSFFPPGESSLRLTARGPLLGGENFLTTSSGSVKHSTRAQKTGAFRVWLLSRAELSHGSYARSRCSRRLPACLRAVEARTVSEARRRLEACRN